MATMTKNDNRVKTAKKIIVVYCNENLISKLRRCQIKSSSCFQSHQKVC